MILLPKHFKARAVFVPMLITTLLLFAFGVILHYQYAETLDKHHVNELILMIKLCEQAVGYMDHAPSREELNHLVGILATVSQSRVSILDEDGRFLADSSLSEAEIQQAESESAQPEIIGAREKGIGVSRHMSRQFNTEMIFVAIQYRSRTHSGYIRASKLASALQHELLSQRIVMIVLYIIALLVMLVMSILTIFTINRRVGREQEHLEERVRERTSQISMLHELGTMLTACKSREEAFEIVGRAGMRMLPGFFGALSLFRSSRNLLEVTVTWNGEWQGEKIFHSGECWGLRTGKSHFSENGIVSCTHGSGPEPNPMLCIPLVAQGETIGVMHISGPIEMFTPENRNLAAAVVEHTGLAMANLQLQESLRNQATRDTLTGLYNRRYLKEFFDSELSRAARRNQSIGVLMLDVDHFKKLNDSFGHDAGDRVLAELGRILLHVLRTEDIVCRYGGEEFVVLLPETGRQECISVAAKIHEKLRSAELKSASAAGRITVSIGAAAYPEHGVTQEELLRAADEALYRAKRNGRNRTETAVPV